MLNRTSFAALLASLSLHPSLPQVWAGYAAHVAPGGLTPEGLAQLYGDGFADALADYELLAAQVAAVS